jgi:tetratricopeptide (TPR) repeat protein
MRAKVSEICASFFAAVEEDRLAVEQALDAEAKAADAEREANGEDEDHDNRKLRKPERMRMVVKNKDEGTELFKGGNFRPAAARYHKALTHASKFFDLSPEDEVEVKALKATIYLNLTSCYIKMENWDQAMRNVSDAINLDDKNPKAYFRRSLVYEAKKDWDKALIDIKKCQELSDVEDKAVTKKAESIKKEIQKEKDKEKKMWGKAFSK